MRVGEILLAHGWVTPDALAGALTEQAVAGGRLCSLLIARGIVAFDQASRALGEQRGVAAVLQRHLDHRDREVVGLLAADVARAQIALPIGRQSDGTLIVCTRDPSPEVAAAIAPAIDGGFVLAVAPAQILERLVDDSYPRAADGVDIGIDVELDLPPTKKPPSRALPAIKRAAVQSRDPLDVVIASLSEIDDLGWLLDVVMEYVAACWSASVLLELRDRRAVGLRGHGRKITPVVVRTFVLALDETAIVRQTCTERRVVDEPPPELDGDDAQLVAALETTAWVAAPIVNGTQVTHVLVVGEPTGKPREDAVIDLGLLAEAMGDAVARIEGA